MGSDRPVGNMVAVLMDSIGNGLRGSVYVLDFEPIEQWEDTMGLVEVIVYYSPILAEYTTCS